MCVRERWCVRKYIYMGLGRQGSPPSTPPTHPLVFDKLVFSDAYRHFADIVSGTFLASHAHTRLDTRTRTRAPTPPPARSSRVKGPMYRPQTFPHFRPSQSILAQSLSFPPICSHLLRIPAPGLPFIGFHQNPSPSPNPNNPHNETTRFPLSFLPFPPYPLSQFSTLAHFLPFPNRCTAGPFLIYFHCFHFFT